MIAAVHINSRKQTGFYFPNRDRPVVDRDAESIDRLDLPDHILRQSPPGEPCGDFRKSGHAADGEERQDDERNDAPVDVLHPDPLWCGALEKEEGVAEWRRHEGDLQRHGDQDRHPGVGEDGSRNGGGKIDRVQCRAEDGKRDHHQLDPVDEKSKQKEDRQDGSEGRPASEPQVSEKPADRIDPSDEPEHQIED